MSQRVTNRRVQPTDTAEIVAFYERLRPLRLRLNNELVGRLSRDALDEGGKKLGIFRRGMFVFDNEDEASVLMDYCIYDVFRGGRNAIGQYLQDNSPDSESDEMACLQAMRHAKYALVLAAADHRRCPHADARGRVPAGSDMHEPRRAAQRHFASRGELRSTLGEVEKRHDGVFQQAVKVDLLCEDARLGIEAIAATRRHSRG